MAKNTPQKLIQAFHDFEEQICVIREEQRRLLAELEKELSQNKMVKIKNFIDAIE
jgi:hypothetical protein